MSAEQLEKWLNTLPKWLQTAASLHLTKPSLSDDEYENLAKLCIAEASGIEDENAFSKVPAGALALTNKFAQFKINSIADVTGINALNSKNPLRFESANLTIVYGENGAGKSGYVRLLKHASGQQTSRELHQNIYSESAVAQAAKIDIETEKSAPVTLNWNKSAGAVPELKNVHIFDTECSQRYLTKPNEPAYEPFFLRFLTVLSETCEKVSACIAKRQLVEISQKPKLPVGLENSPSGLWYSGMTHEIDSKTIEASCLWSDLEEQSLIELQAKLQVNLVQKCAEIDAVIKKCDDFIAESTKKFALVSDEAFSKIIALKTDATAKRKAATEDAKIVFSTQNIGGVGDPNWKLLWEQARKFSEEVAYTSENFPYTENDAHCVLCQQPLADEAKSRMKKFESFVQSGLESVATTAETLLKAELKKIPEYLWTLPELEARLANVGLSDAIKADDFYKLLSERIELIKIADNVDLLPKLDAAYFLKLLNDKKSTLSKEKLEYEALQKAEGRILEENRLSQLKTKKWLSEQKAAVKSEVVHLNKLSKLKAAKALTDTKEITAKKTKLGKSVITEGHIIRFDKELAALKAGAIKVGVQQKASTKGKINLKVSLKDSLLANDEILSEGECRITTLAAFLADVTSEDMCTPFIFDDPISSLDILFETASADRLVELARTRQVIVFTHRLSFISALENAEKKLADSCNKIAIDIINLQKTSTGTGIPSDLPIKYKKPESGLQKLLNEYVAKAKKMEKADELDELEPILEVIYKHIRVITESLIEQTLLGGVVERFRPNISTMKIGELEKITKEDIKMFDDIMTRYSIPMHSQPMESPLIPPSLPEMETDLIMLINWDKERKANAKKAKVAA